MAAKLLGNGWSGRMSIEVDRGYGVSQEQAVAELAEAGFTAEAKEYAPGKTEPHAHDYEVRLYIVEGEFRLLDADSGVVHSCRPGDRVRVSAGVRHAEDHGELKMVVGRR